MKYKTYSRITPVLNVAMYGSIIEPDTVFRDEDYDCDHFNYEKYRKDIGKLAAELLPKFTEGYFDGTGIIGITSEGEIDSPKYYNFANDALVMYIEVTPDFNRVAARKLREWYNEGNTQAIEWCIRNYTSYDGFQSFVPNKLDRIANLIEAGKSMDILPGVYASICLAVGGYFERPDCMGDCGASVAELNQSEFENEVYDNFLASDYITNPTTQED